MNKFVYSCILYLLVISAYGQNQSLEPNGVGQSSPESFTEQKIDTDKGTAISIATNGTTTVVGRAGTSNSVEVYSKNNQGVWQRTQVLVSSFTLGSTTFGQTVSLSENTLFISQPFDDENLPDTVFIYQKNANGIWIETQQIQASTDFLYDGFGSAMAVSENTLVLGANGIPDGGVYIFEKNENNIWMETAQLFPSGYYFNFSFGDALAVSQNQLVIGAPGHEDVGAFIFEKQGDGTWSEVQALASPNGSNREYGTKVAIEDDRIIISDLGYTSGIYNQGQTFVYGKSSNGQWVQEEILEASNGYQEDYFGDALAMNANRIVVNMSANQKDEGWLYVYHKSQGIWAETHILSNSGSTTFDFGNRVAVADGLIIATSKDYVHFFEDSPTAADNDATCSKIVSSDGESSDFFGKVLALSNNGQILAASSYYDDDLAQDSGAVYIFNKNVSGEWQEAQKLLASDGMEDDLFGFSLAFAGETLAIGAYKQNNRTGAVYLFDRSTTGVWEESQKLLASDTAYYQQFGYAISGSEDRLMVGSPNNNDNGTGSGAAYIYEKGSDGAWSETTKLLAADGESQDSFGISVSISKNTGVVGAWYDDDIVENSGAAYIFERTSRENWTEVSKVKASDPKTNSAFGTSVGVSEGTVVVGSASINSNTTEIGAAYVYARSSKGLWMQTKKLNPTDGMPKDRFGLHVAIQGSLIACGIPGDDENGNATGAVQIFRKSNTGNWEPTKKLFACDQEGNYAQFGRGVSLVDGQIAVGTDRFTANGTAFIYDLPAPSIPLEATVNFSNSSCHGSNDAAVDVQVTGGTAPYAYTLTTSDVVGPLTNTTGVFLNIDAGDYIVTVRDADTNEISRSISIPEAELLILTTDITTTCAYDENATLNFRPSGGTSPYLYSIDNGASYSTDPLFTNLAAAEYSLVLKDSNGCIHTQIISLVDDENCPEMNMFETDFIIETTDQTCTSLNDGSISISADENLAYTAALTDGSRISEKAFTTSTRFEDLKAGTYEICITLEGHPEFEKCFPFEIARPKDLQVSSKLDPSEKILTLNMSGGVHYTVVVNGKEYNIMQNELSIPVSKEHNSVMVKTDIECQGVHEEIVSTSDANVRMYPNPVEKGDLSILVPDTENNEVLLTLFSQGGVRVMEKMNTSENGIVQLNIDTLPSGIYTIIITTETQNSIRKIIKR